MKNVCLISFLGLFLSSCNDYPGHKPNDYVKMSPKARWDDANSQVIPLGGDCHIDSINDVSGEVFMSHSVSQSKPPLNVVGWSAISGKEGIVASDVAIALKNKLPPNLRLFAKTTREKRADVAEYFKNPASVDTGFKAAIDISDVSPGEYVLELIQHKDGNTYKCQFTSNITIKN
ncbi:hypothetical protein [Methylicorpusculum sp.]|uniref:hypothetical protein n=1 Tax=Methylicorpusculum sp. TaxID=2713644 RepID=UPI00271A71D3|nr:hypothetical protein [Methylicorpusculum sp.]MDO8843249.1 hypothetical protein [Methylicorpusculum sp.]